MKIRSVLLPIITLAICFGVFYKWTLGFKAFTVFSYTLEKAQPLNKEFPEIELINHDSVLVNLQNTNRYKLTNFVYLNCPFVCHKVNNQLEDIYHLLDSTSFSTNLNFYTISFDLDNDNVQRMNFYRSHFENIPGWDFTIPYQKTEDEFNSFLKSIGIWIYKESANRIINHSTTMYLISPENKVVKIFDPVREDAETIVNQIRQCIGTENLVSL